MFMYAKSSSNFGGMDIILPGEISYPNTELKPKLSD